MTKNEYIPDYFRIKEFIEKFLLWSTEHVGYLVCEPRLHETE